MGAVIAVGIVVIISLIGLLAVFIWSNICYRRALKMSEEIEGKYRGLYEELLAKIKEKAGISEESYVKYPRRMNKPLTGAQLRRINEQQNAAFLDDRGEPTNSEILKEQAHG